jgi:Tol biopolymer transport system component
VTATSDALALEPVAALPVRAPDPGVVVAQTVAGDPRAALVLRAQRLAIAAHDETIDHASTSPDGLHIAFVRRSSGANEHVIVIPTDKMDQDERSFAPLSAFGTPSDEPAWSPDARRLAFVLGAAPLRQIAIVAMDRPVPRDPAGAPAPSVVADPGPKAFMRDDHAPTFSPDGVWVSFLSARDASSDGVHDVFVMRIDGEEVRRLTSSEHDCTSARWAADGWIYFASKDSFYRVKPR